MSRSSRWPGSRRRVRPGPVAGLAPWREDPPAGRVLDARLHLLDRQVLDADREPVMTVSDAEVRSLDGAPDPTGEDAAVLTALLAGPVLATRLFGGRPPESRWLRVAWADVAEVGIILRLGRRAEGLEVGWVERWLRDHIVARIPGGRHDPE